MLTKPTVVIISQHTHTSSHYAVHFNTMSCVCVFLMFSISFLICSYIVFPDLVRLCSFSALNFINMIILNFYCQIIHQSLISLGSVSGDLFFFDCPVAPCLVFSYTALFFSIVIICVFEL